MLSAACSPLQIYLLSSTDKWCPFPPPCWLLLIHWFQKTVHIHCGHEHLRITLPFHTSFIDAVHEIWASDLTRTKTRVAGARVFAQAETNRWNQVALTIRLSVNMCHIHWVHVVLDFIVRLIQETINGC